MVHCCRSRCRPIIWISGFFLHLSFTTAFDTRTPGGVLPSVQPTVDKAVATVWINPSGLHAGALAWRNVKGNTFWGNASQWGTYLEVRDKDADMLLASLGHHPNSTAIIFFQAYLADISTWTDAPLQRLNYAVQHFSVRGIKPLIFFGDPEFYGIGTWATTHDVVHNTTAQAYLLKNIRTVLALDAVQQYVDHASVYWLGASTRCTGGVNVDATTVSPLGGGDWQVHGRDVQGSAPSICTEDDIAQYNTALRTTFASENVSFLAHVDGPFWNGCTPQPCDPKKWIVSGYSPASLKRARVDGLLGESWTMGTLVDAVETLLAFGTVPAREVVLLNDVPNCDLQSTFKCSTGSVASDTAQWFQWWQQLGLGAWGVWDFIDGGIGDSNGYGDVLLEANGSVSLTAKGRLHAAFAQTQQ
eukprot:m.503845 g.503845  ORF g.503845 m.503845 type:complete len:415 (+) comp21853_c0_seq18:89-1333(+)